MLETIEKLTKHSTNQTSSSTQSTSDYFFYYENYYMRNPEEIQILDKSAGNTPSSRFDVECSDNTTSGDEYNDYDNLVEYKTHNNSHRTCDRNMLPHNTNKPANKCAFIVDMLSSSRLKLKETTANHQFNKSFSYTNNNNKNNHNHNNNNNTNLLFDTYQTHTKYMNTEELKEQKQQQENSSSEYIVKKNYNNQKSNINITSTTNTITEDFLATKQTQNDEIKLGNVNSLRKIFLNSTTTSTDYLHQTKRKAIQMLNTYQTADSECNAVHHMTSNDCAVLNPIKFVADEIEIDSAHDEPVSDIGFVEQSTHVFENTPPKIQVVGDAQATNTITDTFMLIKSCLIESREYNSSIENIFSEVHSKLKDIANYISTNSISNIVEFHTDTRNSTDSTTPSVDPEHNIDDTIDESIKRIVSLNEQDYGLGKKTHEKNDRNDVEKKEENLKPRSSSYYL